MKRKLLYVAPHLSTGGQPQYLYKQIEHFLNEFEIQVVEINNTGGDAFVVQKNKIKSLVTLHTLGDDKSEILNIIEDFKPDIIHFQEIPQFNLSTDILNKIWKRDRAYFIICTTHGSFTTPSDITHHPDRYVLVSKWSKQRFDEAELGVETQLWEYPIEDFIPNREERKGELGLESDWKHVLMVGLFTPGKNQGEIFDVARTLEKYKIKFHFVGNQAGNFEDYWRPIMMYKPDNCFIWGERNDTEKFYEACDMFYFSSKLELNPLSIKEALSWKLPSIFRRLHTFLDTYDDNPLVQYIDDDLTKTKRIILQTLKPEFNEIPGWFSFSELCDTAVDVTPSDGKIVEIGSWFGKSTNYMVDKIKGANKQIEFTTVDTFKGSEEDVHKVIVNSFNGDIFYEFVDNLTYSNNYDKFNIIKDTSKNASTHFSNNSIDFLIIDAGHYYDNLMEDFHSWYHKVKAGGYISGDDYGVFDGVTKATDEFFYGQHTKVLHSFMRRKPRIQIRHLLTRPDDLRERVSIASIKQLEAYGIDYQPIVNKPYEGLAPETNCRRPEHISKDNKPGELWPGAGLGWITGRHYGCYLAHRGALESIDEENYDYTLIFEADAYIFTGLEEFVNMVHKACFISERDDVYYIGLSDNPSRHKERVDDLFSKTGANQDLAHAYLIPNRTKGWWMERLEDCGWDVGDLWYNHVFANHPKSRYTTNKMYSKQAEGYSLLDETIKSWN